MAATKRVVAVGLVLVMTIAAGETFARYGLGLGDAPVVVAHPSIEYMFAPNQDAWPFHNRFSTNEYGMRSPPLTDDPRVRVLVLGDSVPNGGNLTDQDALATSLLTTNETLYLNASAGSWGPANMLAYVKAFGFFGAGRTVIILSSHDANDVPTFGALDPNTHPTTRPLSALWEAVAKYLPRYLPGYTAATTADTPPPDGEDTAIAAARELLRLASANGPVCLVLHSTRDEGDAEEPFTDLLHAGQEASAKIVRDAAFLDASSYRDAIHPNDNGQADLARAIASCWD